MALQIMHSFDDEEFLEACVWQKIVNMPASDIFLAKQDLKVAIHPFQTARTSCRTGVGVIASRKAHNTQRSDFYLSLRFKIENEGVNSGLIALRLHERARLNGYLSLMLIEE